MEQPETNTERHRQHPPDRWPHGHGWRQDAGRRSTLKQRLARLSRLARLKKSVQQQRAQCRCGRRNQDVGGVGPACWREQLAQLHRECHTSGEPARMAPRQRQRPAPQSDGRVQETHREQTLQRHRLAGVVVVIKRNEAKLAAEQPRQGLVDCSPVACGQSAQDEDRQQVQHGQRPDQAAQHGTPLGNAPDMPPIPQPGPYEPTRASREDRNPLAHARTHEPLPQLDHEAQADAQPECDRQGNLRMRR